MRAGLPLALKAWQTQRRCLHARASAIPSTRWQQPGAGAGARGQPIAQAYLAAGPKRIIIKIIICLMSITLIIINITIFIIKNKNILNFNNINYNTNNNNFNVNINIIIIIIYNTTKNIF
jgi:hypothetical protein